MSEILAPIITALIAAVVGGAYKLVDKWLTQRFKPNQLGAISGFAEAVVQAAEQAAANLGWNGEQKLAYATESLISLAQRVGVKLSVTDADALVHAALKGIKDYDKYSQDTVTNAVQGAYSQGLDEGIQSVLDRIEADLTPAPAVDGAEPLAA